MQIKTISCRHPAPWPNHFSSWGTTHSLTLWLLHIKADRFGLPGPWVSTTVFSFIQGPLRHFFGILHAPVSPFRTIADTCGSMGWKKTDLSPNSSRSAGYESALSWEITTKASGSRTLIRLRLLSTRPCFSQALSRRLAVCNVVAVSSDRS